MARHPWAVVALAAALVAALPSGARADVNLTGFLGVTTVPEVRPSGGLAAGVGLVVVGFEAEYAAIAGDATEERPSLQTGMLNVLVQTPPSIGRVQLYATVGGGAYREKLRDDTHTSVGVNLGAGLRIKIKGPLRARIDYRVFRLYGSAAEPNVQRLYLGLGLAF